MNDAFFTIHNHLYREGPGEPADIEWVLAQRPVPARVLDAACGPGADTVTLAERLPDAQILAVEAHAPFAWDARNRCRPFGARVTCKEGDMFAQNGPFDLIWCAGAAYFAGVAEALTAWRPQLATGGAVAFSEPVKLPNWNAAAEEFWAEYPQITDEAGILARVAAAGYRTIGTRVIVGQSWANYYDDLQYAIDWHRKPNISEALLTALEENQQEVINWRKARDEVAYLLVLAEPADV